jgi:tRNA dimethylallyltransferase
MRPAVFGDALILTGPTASGKTSLAIELAELLNAEIVAMDSMTLYRGMDVGTAKPSAEERRRVRHHLLDVLDPGESASVAWWLERAAASCADIEGRGKKALFVGGTPLYLKALLRGLFDGPPADAAVRTRLEADAGREGPPALHGRLAGLDPATAARLHPNDLRRVIRALEVHELTGKRLSDWQTEWRDPPAAGELASGRCLCLQLDRDELYSRIDARAERMLAGGLLDEARALRGPGRSLGREASQAVGYREAFDLLDGKIGYDEALTRIRTRSRQLAKRQLTWFRSLPECRPVSAELTFVAWGLKIPVSYS